MREKSRPIKTIILTEYRTKFAQDNAKSNEIANGRSCSVN
jgi:hypothetical protein